MVILSIPLELLIDGWKQSCTEESLVPKMASFDDVGDSKTPLILYSLSLLVLPVVENLFVGLEKPYGQSEFKSSQIQTGLKLSTMWTCWKTNMICSGGHHDAAVCWRAATLPVWRIGLPIGAWSKWLEQLGR